MPNKTPRKSSQSRSTPTKTSTSSQSKAHVEEIVVDSPYRKAGWTVVKLKEELQKRDMPTSGKKEELIQRLESAVSGGDEEEVESSQKGGKKKAQVDKKLSPKPSKRESGASSSSAPSNINKAKNGAKRELHLWNAPITTFKLFFLELYDLTAGAIVYAASHRALIGALLILASIFGAGRYIDNPYRASFVIFEDWSVWYLYWLILGIASSIGLGTGLHTFVLFLGPHIAHVTLLAFDCGGLDFATNGPDAFKCQNPLKDIDVPFAAIYSKVMLDALFWGIGTAIGELPPYFVARAAALAGKEDEEFDNIQKIQAMAPKDRTLSDRVSLMMFNLMTKFGFFGILLSASVPNPLFDLAGITCGHFNVPFRTFFGATLIGKSFFKANIQACSMIILFTRENINKILLFIERNIPSLHGIASDFFDKQRNKFQSKSNAVSSSVISDVWNVFIVMMIGYFALSIVNSLATSRLNRENSRTGKSVKSA